MAVLDKRELLKTISFDECLHCRIGALVKLHFAQHGELRDGKRLISVQEALQQMALVAGDLLAVHPDAAKREKFICEMADDAREATAHAIEDHTPYPADIAWEQ